MDQHTYDILYKIDRTIKTILNIAACAFLILIVLVLFNTPWKQTIGNLSLIALGVCLLSAICRIGLSFFVKSDEQEEFEKQVDYILQQKQAESAINSRAYTPLRDVSAEQDKQIRQILKDLPENPNKPNQINMAYIARYLTALERMNKADLTNRHALRLWVAEVTGKQVPNSSQFNEALPSTNRKELLKAQDMLTAVLEGIETLSHTLPN